MKSRILSALVMLIICVPLIYFGSHVYNAGVIILSALAYKEMLNLKWFKELPLVVKLLGFVTMINTVISGVYFTKGIDYIVLLVPFIVTYLVSIMFKTRKYTTKEVMYLLLLVLLIGFGFNGLIMFRIDIKMLLYIVLICVLSDTFAYITGMLIGKHKLCPSISPKKTIEGSIGGLIVSVVLVSLYSHFILESLTIWVFIGTVILAIMSQLGDLLFSKIKRVNDIKDFSNLIPGHGGILDRLDSVLVVSFTYMLYILITLTGLGSVILLILILGAIILIHELGHFMWAKIFKVHIYEFSLGMGPVLLSKKGKDNVDYNIRAVPIGGFVSMAGEVYEDGEENKIEKSSYMCNKPWWQRIIILVAGVTYNFISAIIILFFISFLWKAPTQTTEIKAVSPGLPMEAAGIKEGDVIVEINGHKTSSWDVAQIVLFFEDEDNVYEFKVDRDGEVLTFNVTPSVIKDENGNEVRQFGIHINAVEPEGIVDSLKYSVTRFGTIVESMILTLSGLFTGKLSLGALSGPIGMYEAVDASASAGLLSVFSLIALLSINVGFLNILPFPAFDGGRVIFVFIEKIKGSPVNSKVENMFHFVGFILLMILTVYIAIQDIIRLS